MNIFSRSNSCYFFWRRVFTMGGMITVFSTLGFHSLFPINLYYLFQIDGGINLFNENEDAIIAKYNLDDLRDTIAPVIQVRTGVVLDRNWLALIGYGFIRRETYDFRLNYFTYNQKVNEQRDIHNVHVQSGYFLFPYQSDFNIFFGIGMGWALYRSTLTTIDDYGAPPSSRLRQRNQLIVFQTHQFFLSPSIKLYRNLRSGLGLGGDVYLGIQYPMLFPSKVNFPEIVLGFDASIDFSFTSGEERKTFVPESKLEETDKKIKEIEGEVEDFQEEIDNPQSDSIDNQELEEVRRNP